MPQYELNLRDYLRIFRKRRFVILTVFFAVTIASAAFLSSQPSVYKADVTIKIEERKTIAGMLTEWIMYNPGDIMESHTKTIKGYPVLKKVALKMGMLKSGATLQETNDAVSVLQNLVETERISQTNMIKIFVTAENGKKAMDIANTVAEVYIEENLIDKAKQARHVRQFIEEQLNSLETRLKAAEDKRETFTGAVKNLQMNGPIQNKLVDLQFELAELLQKYTDKHPKIIQLQDQIAQMESQVSASSGQELEYSRLNREIEVNRKLYGMLKEKLEEARINEAQKVGDISIVNPAFLPEAPMSGANNKLKVLIGAFMGLLLGLTCAFIMETMDTSISTIEDVENAIKLPILGAIPPIQEELPEKTPWFTRLTKRFMPQKPETPTEERQIRLVSHFHPQSPVTEAYRNVFTNLKPDQQKKVMMVTSSGPREGKSTVVANLGVVLAQNGLKTVLVSADMRRPVLAKIFGIRREPGLAELLDGSIDLSAALCTINDLIIGEMNFDDIRKTPGLENLSIIPAGKNPYNPVKLLGSKELTHLIDTLRAQFDVVIFDTPPVLPVTDASLIAPKMDNVMIVYEIGRTSREALMRTKIQLESTGAKLAGIILNNTQPNSEAVALYPYYSRHKYRYYHQIEPEPKGNAKTHG